jgi:hypothetical protein
METQYPATMAHLDIFDNCMGIHLDEKRHTKSANPGVTVNQVVSDEVH